MRRPPYTLWRSIFADLFRLVALSAGVMVTVIAFAGAVKPISDGVLQAGDVLRYISFALIPMLAYALPFASGFAATIVYHRIATDNESTAAYAGGISHRTLLAPAVAAALVLSLMLVALNQSIIPRFLEQMQRLITVDVARLVAQEIQRGKAVELRDTMILADQAQPVQPDPSSGASDQLLLKNFAAVKTDKDGTPIQEVTASLATMWLFPASSAPASQTDDEQSGRAMVVIRLANVVALEQGRGAGGYRDSVDLGIPVPNTFRDNPKFLSWADLRALKAHPERMNWIDASRKALAFTLAEREGIIAMRSELESGGLITLMDEERRPVRVRAARMDWEGTRWRLTPARGKPIEVELTRPGSRGSTFVTAAGATMTNPVSAGELPSQRLIYRLELERATVREVDAQGLGVQAQRDTLPISGLRYPPTPVDQVLALSSRAMLERSRPWVEGPTPDPTVVAPYREMSRLLSRLENQVLAKQHERMALAASCFVMIITGAIASLHLSRRMPLTVYLFTFFPALAAMVTINGGQQVILQSGSAGLLLLWGGVAALAAYSGIMYMVLRRH